MLITKIHDCAAMSHFHARFTPGVQASELNELVDSINGAMPADAAARLKRLYKYIEDAADDAHAFASQAASDAKRHHLGTSTGLTGDEGGSAAQAATNDAATDDKVRLLATSSTLFLLAVSYYCQGSVSTDRLDAN